MFSVLLQLIIYPGKTTNKSGMAGDKTLVPYKINKYFGNLLILSL